MNNEVQVTLSLMF